MKKTHHYRKQLENNSLPEGIKITPDAKRPKHQESLLQRGCVKWYRHQFPQYKKLLFAIPNGGYRSSVEASIMQGEGVVAGVSDMMLAIPKHGFHGLFIEFKFGKNDLSAHQQEFKNQVEKHGYKHITCWSFDEFIKEINFYLLPIYQEFVDGKKIEIVNFREINL